MTNHPVHHGSHLTLRDLIERINEVESSGRLKRKFAKIYRQRAERLIPKAGYFSPDVIFEALFNGASKEVRALMQNDPNRTATDATR